jgi:hypothetical protein
MASQQAAPGVSKSATGAVSLKRFDRIERATWAETALAAQDWAKNALIAPNTQYAPARGK